MRSWKENVWSVFLIEDLEIVANTFSVHRLMNILMNPALNKLIKTQSSTDWMRLQRDSDESDLKLKLHQRDEEDKDSSFSVRDGKRGMKPKRRGREKKRERKESEATDDTSYERVSSLSVVEVSQSQRRQKQPRL